MISSGSRVPEYQYTPFLVCTTEFPVASVDLLTEQICLLSGCTAWVCPKIGSVSVPDPRVFIPVSPPIPINLVTMFGFRVEKSFRSDHSEDWAPESTNANFVGLCSFTA